MRRVVVTGIGAFSPLGSEWRHVRQHLESGRNRVVRMADWANYDGLNTQVAAPVTDFELPAHYTRSKRRTMDRIAQMAVRASELALERAGLLDDAVLTDGRTGVSYGSSSGSTQAIRDFGQVLLNQSLDGMNATSYVRMMSHTAAVNIGVFFAAKGRIIPTSSACTAGSQGIGYAYEAIRHGLQTVMIAGGSEALCPTAAAVFDVLYATSTRNEEPRSTPRPFDRDRDGLVIGEGAGTLILEDWEFATARGAPILAEIVGYATNSDGAHVTRPNQETMAMALRTALEQAGLPASEIGYVNAHGTATEHGDIAETQATREVFGRAVPISSLKSYIGHTLGACGALEAWLSIEMMNQEWFAPTANLDNVDARCGELDYITGGGRTMSHEFVMSNNFAFGGINTSLIFRRHT